MSTQNLEDAITRIDLLLNDTIDVLVKPWEYKEPNFYKAYLNARILVDAASRKSKTNEPVEAPAAEESSTAKQNSKNLAGRMLVRFFLI